MNSMNQRSKFSGTDSLPLQNISFSIRRSYQSNCSISVVFYVVSRLRLRSLKMAPGYLDHQDDASNSKKLKGQGLLGAGWQFLTSPNWLFQSVVNLA
jgi:hypothetical protein